MFSQLQNLIIEIQQHQLTIQQLEEQVQALSSLKRPRSPVDQPSPSQQESTANSEATDIDMDTDTSPGLEHQARFDSSGGGGFDASGTNKIGTVGKTGPTICTVGLDEDEVSSCNKVFTLEAHHDIEVSSQTCHLLRLHLNTSIRASLLGTVHSNRTAMKFNIADLHKCCCTGFCSMCNGRVLYIDVLAAPPACCPLAQHQMGRHSASRYKCNCLL